MTTNYGERPGLEPQSGDAREARTVDPREGLGTIVPRTMSAATEADIRTTWPLDGRSDAPTLLRELDAERAAHAATLAMLEDARYMLRQYHKGEAPGHLDACEMPDNCVHCLLCRKLDAAIAQARGGAGGHA